MSWKESARRTLGWPTRRLFNPRFEAVAHEISRAREASQVDAEASRQLTAAVERSLAEAAQENALSMIEVSAHISDRVDRVLVVLERLELRLAAVEAALDTSRSDAT